MKYQTQQTPPHFRGTNYLRRVQAAQKTGLSVRTMERLAIDGGGPPFAIVGRIPLYPEDELDAWLRARLVTSTSAATVAAQQAAE